MRTIKFRGKRIDNGKWVYGYLTELFSKNEKRFAIDEANYFDYEENSLNVFEVISESVGQFTEFYDENGKEIYEGDLLGKFREKPLQVYFNDGQFQIKEIGSITLIDLAIGKYVLSNHKVIGNIYDNPELLK